MSHYKAYPKYKDSGVEWIGEVPEHWDVKPIKFVASYNDDSLAETEAANTLIRYVDISSVSHDEGIGSVDEMLFGNAPSRARRKAKTGDVIISTVRTYLKAVAAVDDEHADCVYSTGFAVLRARRDHVNPSFLKWLSLNELFIQSVESHSEGLSYPAINAPVLVGLKSTVPSLPEQTDIAIMLDRETARIDAIIAKKTRFIDLLKEKRSALITHAVTKGINPNVKMKDSGVEWTGEVPEHWELRKIAHAFECIGSGTTPPSDQDKWYSDGEIPWITTGELRETVITETSKCVTTKALEEFSTLRLYPAGSLAMAMYGATIGRLGILGVPATTNQACCVLSGEISLSIQYAYFWLLAFKQQIIDLYAAGGGQPNINQEVIAFLRVPAPNLVEQATITAFLDRETARIDLLTQKTQHSIDLLKERRSALITAAVTGQIDLREQA